MVNETNKFLELLKWTSIFFALFGGGFLRMQGKPSCFNFYANALGAAVYNSLVPCTISFATWLILRKINKEFASKHIFLLQFIHIVCTALFLSTSPDSDCGPIKFSKSGVFFVLPFLLIVGALDYVVSHPKRAKRLVLRIAAKTRSFLKWLRRRNALPTMQDLSLLKNSHSTPAFSSGDCSLPTTETCQQTYCSTFPNFAAFSSPTSFSPPRFFSSPNFLSSTSSFSSTPTSSPASNTLHSSEASPFLVSPSPFQLNGISDPSSKPEESTPPSAQTDFKRRKSSTPSKKHSSTNVTSWEHIERTTRSGKRYGSVRFSSELGFSVQKDAIPSTTAEHEEE